MNKLLHLIIITLVFWIVWYLGEDDPEGKKGYENLYIYQKFLLPIAIVLSFITFVYFIYVIIT